MHGEKMLSNKWTKRWLPMGFIFYLVVSPPISAQDISVQSISAQGIGKKYWTLESSIERVLQIAPEIKSAAANIQAHQGSLEQAGAWENPTFSLRTDNKIGLEDGNGGQDLTQFNISQPIPLFGQLKHKKSIAKSQLDTAKSQGSYQRLNLEQQIAERFHRLQFTAANYELAKERLLFADKLTDVGNRRAQAGDMATLERLRLNLIRESAKQLVDKTEGQFNEALNLYRALLNLANTQIPELAPLTPIKNVLPLASFLEKLPQHPLMMVANHHVNTATADVALTKAERLPKLALGLYREREFLGGRVQNVNGIGLSFSIPLWDMSRGKLKKTHARVEQGYADRHTVQRDLISRIQQNHLHLNHIIEQSKYYQTHVFQPSQQVFEMTRKAYAAGEMDILSLIDANNIYFDTQGRYLELLQEAWLELADLRLAAGQSISSAGLDYE